MSTNPAADQIARLLVEREDLLLDHRELEARLDRLRRRLDDVNTEIASLHRVERELLQRHPELEQD
jgi:tetrahydromethanopterin S-methyltransferase subunit G